jgi:hypothetical protein
MIAAVYATKSTERNGVSDEDKSVTRQVDHDRANTVPKCSRASFRSRRCKCRLDGSGDSAEDGSAK